MDNPRDNKGNNGINPNDKAGDDWLGLSQNQKDNLGAASGAVGISAIPAAVFGSAGPAIAVLAVGVIQIIASQGDPVPDAITGTFSGIAVGKTV